MRRSQNFARTHTGRKRGKIFPDKSIYKGRAALKHGIRNPETETETESRKRKRKQKTEYGNKFQ